MTPLILRSTAAALALLAAGPALAQNVDAPAGAIEGTEQDGLHIYEGIPYAEPPVGERRWAPPVPKAPFETTYRATDPGTDCVQAATFWRPGDAASTDEDCLSLTVYAPAEGGGDLPVFVGFHGGGSVNGAKTDWEPKALASEGNVVVTVNYRLGAMGFLALPELAEEAGDSLGGNYGELDRTEALRWVQENIASFGGDPDRVTIAGQSAGARGVCFQLASPDSEGLFDAAIIQSGRDCPMNTYESAEAGYEDFVSVAGCADAEDRLACLRELSAAEVLAAQLDSDFGARTIIGGSGLPADTAELFASGDFNQVPVIIGQTFGERRASIYENNDLVRMPVTQAMWEEEVRAEFPDNADAILEAYAEDAAVAPGLALANLDSDTGSCGPNAAIEGMAQHVPVYVYEFRDETAPARPYMVIPPSYPIGTGHSAELPYTWGTLIEGELSAEQEELAQVMRDYWSAVAAPEGMAAAGQSDWPAWTADNPQRLLLLEGGDVQVVDDAAFFADHRCELFETSKG